MRCASGSTRGGRVVVVGAGWIGSEFAASARQRGLEVTLIDPLALPNERIFGPEIGAFYRDVHAQHGVELVLGDGVEAFEGDGACQRVRTSSGRVDRLRLRRRRHRRHAARRARRRRRPRRRQRDRRRRAASDLRARTCSRRATSRTRGTRSTSERIRVEHWANALNQGPAAARAMLGEPVSYDRIPYFFSDQYDVGMEYSGYATELGRGRVPRRPRRGRVHRFLAADGRVVAGMNVNVWDVNEHVQALIRSRQPVEPRARPIPTPLDSLAGELAGD